MDEPKILKDPPVPKYVVGFLFNSDFSEVVLIKKTKPEWQNGLLNGVGGKTEPGETAVEAMAREFREETGLNDPLNWMPFASFHSGKYDPSSPNQVIACFTACTWDTLFYTVKTTTEEEVHTIKVKDIPTAKTVPNLKWLVPLALDFYREGGDKVRSNSFLKERMAHRLDSEIYKMYNDLLGDIAKAKVSKSKKKTLLVDTTAMAHSRDEAVRLRHKHLAVAKLLSRDGYTVSFSPEGDEMPKGTYDKPLDVVLIVEVVREDSDVPADEG